MKESDIRSRWHWVTLFVGVGMMAFGLLFSPVFPHLALDQLLTPEQLQEEETVNLSLKLLKTAQRGWPRLFTITGAIVSICGIAGLTQGKPG